MHAYVSDMAHDQWHDFAAVNGVSVSAFLEALGPELDMLTGRDIELVRAARRIDAARRRRRQTA